MGLVEASSCIEVPQLIATLAWSLAQCLCSLAQAMIMKSASRAGCSADSNDYELRGHRSGRNKKCIGTMQRSTNCMGTISPTCGTIVRTSNKIKCKFEVT
jgi:hypothetical protein